MKEILFVVEKVQKAERFCLDTWGGFRKELRLTVLSRVRTSLDKP